MTKERKTEIGGVSIGKKRDPLRDLVELFDKNGIHVHNRTLSILRMPEGSANGDILAYKLRISDLLSSNNAGAKYSNLGGIFDEIIRLEKPTQTRPLRRDWKGLTEAAAQNIKMNDQTLRRTLRAVRADLVTTTCLNPEIRDVATPFFCKSG